MITTTRILSLFLLLPSTVFGFSATAPTTSKAVGNDIFEHLKFNGAEPTFDVMAKAQEYTSTFSTTSGPPGPEWYAEDYVLRGPVIGPINLKDLRSAQGGFDYSVAYPDLHIETFGHTIDPENPFRCFYFQRWRGTHTGTLTVPGGSDMPASGRTMETPTSVFTVVFNPEGKIVYEQVGSPVDRFEGNTEGKAAVFGMLHNAGLKLPGTPGDWVLRLLQRLGHLSKETGRSFSREEDIPKWWTSAARGADPSDK